jgi:hypothetical protein
MVHVWVLFEVEGTQLELREVFATETQARLHMNTLKEEYKLREFLNYQEWKVAGTYLHYKSFSASRGSLCIGVHDIKTVSRQFYLEFVHWWDTLSSTSVLTPDFDDIYSILYIQPVFQLERKLLL